MSMRRFTAATFAASLATGIATGAEHIVGDAPVALVDK
jgi:hypothetical protein